MKFDMSVSDNYASYFDGQNGSHIFIDSFDNTKFEMRIGSLDNSKSVGSVIASNDGELNIRLLGLYIKYINTLKLNEV
ncbi:MAG: hypothetical protein ACI6PR_14365 [Pseudoalteromonas sp.]|uniref:hypothetical protein n=1 Tax=Pseudoalteromonas sp. TaxID=53249 RepID=UPI003063089A